MKQRKLILVNPIIHARAGLSSSMRSCYPPLNLAVIAALTPAHWDVEIIDENIRPFKFKTADLVGITGLTSVIPRAYEISEIYREKGIKTILGGLHTSLLPEEASKYADSIVVGEAEGIWGKVIADFESGNLLRRYQAEITKEFIQPFPRRDLLSKYYWFTSIQTSRGCPFNCSFCSVPGVYGNTFRNRPVDKILDELEQIPQSIIFFVDDNLIGYSKKSKENAISLFKGMIDRKLNKEWFTFASINFADDPELLYYAAKSGCKMVFIGFETINQESLNEYDKHINLNRYNKYKQVIRKIHKYKIGIIGGFIVGSDNDTPKSLSKLMNFITFSGVDTVHLTPLTPFPGTALFKEYKENNRLHRTNFPFDWHRYDWRETVINPLGLTHNTFNAIMQKLWKKVYSYSFIYYKFLTTLMLTRSLRIAKWSLDTNINLRRVFYKPLKKSEALFNN